MLSPVRGPLEGPSLTDPHSDLARPAAGMGRCLVVRRAALAETIGYELQMIRRTVLVACALVVCACSSGPARPMPPSGLAGGGSAATDNWVIVAPGGGGPSNTPARLDVFRGTARAVSRVPGPPGRHGVTIYPWAVSGEYVAAVTGILESARNGRPAGGVAFAFRPGGSYVRLGRAVAVFAASQPGRFWIRSARFGGSTHGGRPRHCTVTEMSAAGRRIAGPMAAPCARWIIAAVPGGFVSVPTATANAARIPQAGQVSPETPVQLWDPVSGKIVRTYDINPGWIYGASSQYLAWRSRSAAGQQLPRVEITNLSTGMTRRFAVPLYAGDVIWRDPVLAPQGPYLAWKEISRATFRKFSAEVRLVARQPAPVRHSQPHPPAHRAHLVRRRAYPQRAAPQLP